MIKLAWRQFRSQAFVALGTLALVAIIAAATRPYLTHALAEPSGRTLIEGPLRLLRDTFTVMVVAAPVLCGVFWGAPLIARELETGTFRLVWTQSVSRVRWLGMKLLVAGLASAAVAGLVSLTATWWSSPLYDVGFVGQAVVNRFDLLLFSAMGLAPLGYGAFGFMVGVTAGLLFRRTMPAMALTLAVFAALRMAITFWVRPFYMAPAETSLSLTSPLVDVSVTKVASGGVRLEPFAQIPNAWAYSVEIVDKAGHSPAADVLASATVGGDQPSAIVDKLATAYDALVVYQPASRFWAFQAMETAVFMLLAILLAGLCFWWVRCRLA